MNTPIPTNSDTKDATKEEIGIEPTGTDISPFMLGQAYLIFHFVPSFRLALRQLAIS